MVHGNQTQVPMLVEQAFCGLVVLPHSPEQLLLKLSKKNKEFLLLFILAQFQTCISISIEYIVNNFGMLSYILLFYYIILTFQI